MHYYASICNFYRQWRPAIFFGKSWDNFSKVLPPELFGTSTAIAVCCLKADWQTLNLVFFFYQDFCLPKLFYQIFLLRFFLMNSFYKITVFPILPYQSCQTKLNLPNQMYQAKHTKPNLPNQTYQSKPDKANLPNQTKPSKPNLSNQNYLTKPTKPFQTMLVNKIKTRN